MGSSVLLFGVPSLRGFDITNSNTFVCMHMCMHVCMYVFRYVCLQTFRHVCMSVCVCVCVSVCVFSVHLCMYVCLCMCTAVAAPPDDAADAAVVVFGLAGAAGIVSADVGAGHPSYYKS